MSSHSQVCLGSNNPKFLGYSRKAGVLRSPLESCRESHSLAATPSSEANSPSSPVLSRIGSLTGQLFPGTTQGKESWEMSLAPFMQPGGELLREENVGLARNLFFFSIPSYGKIRMNLSANPRAVNKSGFGWENKSYSVDSREKGFY